MLETFSRSLYAADLLSVGAMACAKFSVVELVRLLAPYSLYTHRLIINVAVALWIIFSLLGLGLQCESHRPWNSSLERCAQGAFFYASTSINMVTDADLALLFIPSIWALQMPLATRIEIIAYFGSRFL